MFKGNMHYTIHSSNLWHSLRLRKLNWIQNQNWGFRKSENNELVMVETLLQLIKAITLQDVWQLQLIKYLCHIVLRFYIH